MTDIQPITGSIPDDWPILDADTPIFNEVAVHLGLITTVSEVSSMTRIEPEPEPDTGEDSRGESQ